MTGKVKWFNRTKGFGFISSADGDIFVHKSDVTEELKEGDKVEFELAQAPKGMKAVNIKVLLSTPMNTHVRG